ncbi:ribonuclease H-like domain-containing protein [Tanacetum coccineum]
MKFNNKDAARFDKKKVKCYKCSELGHFARECTGKQLDSKARYSSFKLKELDKSEEPKALLSVDSMLNWSDHEGEDVENGAAQVYGMIAGAEDDAGSATVMLLVMLLMMFLMLLLNLPLWVSLLRFKHIKAKLEKLNDKVKLEESKTRFDKWKDSSKNLDKLIHSSMSSRSKFGLAHKLPNYLGNLLGIYSSAIQDLRVGWTVTGCLRKGGLLQQCVVCSGPIIAISQNSTLNMLTWFKEAATVATLKLYTRTEEEIEAKILAAPTSANGASKRQFNVSSLDTVRNFANEFIPNKGARIEAKLQVEKEKLETVDFKTFREVLDQYCIYVWNEPDGTKIRVHGGDYRITMFLSMAEKKMYFFKGWDTFESIIKRIEREHNLTRGSYELSYKHFDASVGDQVIIKNDCHWHEAVRSFKSKSYVMPLNLKKIPGVGSTSVSAE